MWNKQSWLPVGGPQNMSDRHEQQPQVQHFLPFGLLLNSEPTRLDLTKIIQWKKRAKTRFVMFIQI